MPSTDCGRGPWQGEQRLHSCRGECPVCNMKNSVQELRLYHIMRWHVAHRRAKRQMRDFMAQPEALTTSSTTRSRMRPGPCGKACICGMVLASLRGSLALAQWDTGQQVFHSVEEMVLRYATNLPRRRYRWWRYCLTPHRHCCPRRDAATEAALYGRAGPGRHGLVSLGCCISTCAAGAA